MTEEDKQLLFKDLSARLPYGVMVLVKGEKYFNETNEPYIVTLSFGTYLFDDEDITLVPYLRPMSSMTEEEEDEYMIARQKDIAEAYIHATPQNAIDWLNAHHFDYRGLIEKGLALEASEDMYIF